MNRPWNSCRARLRKAAAALAVTVFAVAGVAATPPRIDESRLLDLGFKVLVATTKVQQDWAVGKVASH